MHPLPEGRKSEKSRLVVLTLSDVVFEIGFGLGLKYGKETVAGADVGG